MCNNKQQNGFFKKLKSTKNNVMGLLILLLLFAAANCSSITKVVYVMVENRSFGEEKKSQRSFSPLLTLSSSDHLFGSKSNVNGLNGKTFSNLVNSSNPSSQRVDFSWDASYINTCDPNHNVDMTTDKERKKGKKERKVH